MDGAIDRRAAVVQAVRTGARSRAEVERQVGGYSRTVRSAIDEAIDEGLIHETVASYPARGGRSRSGRGLAPGPSAERPSHRITLSALRRRRLAAGLSQRQLASRLGVSVMLVNHWEKGRQPVSSAYYGALAEALAERAPSGAEERIGRKAEEVLGVLSAAGPLPLNALVARVGGARTTRAALERLLATNRIHRGVIFVRSKGASSRSCPAFVAGPAPRGTPSLDSSELRRLRQRSGLTQEELGQAVSVSTAAIGRWERESVPAWAAPGLLGVLHELPPVDRLAKAESEVVELIGRCPAGISRKALRRALGRQDAVVGKAIERSLARGVIHEDATGAKHGRRRLHATPPPAQLSGGELADRRCALGWSQRELGALTDISGSLISGYENGRPVPTEKRRALLQALAAGENGSLPRGKPVRRRGQPYSPAAGDSWLAALSQPRPWAEVIKELRAASTQSPGRHLLETWIRAGRVHTYEELVPGRRGCLRRRMLAAGPARPRLVLTGAELAERRQAAGLSRPELARAVGLHHVGGRIGAWENGGELIPDVWAEELLAAVDRHGKGVPRPDSLRSSDDELRRAAFDLVAATPGALSGTQLTQHLPGDVRRRWRVLGELEAQGLVHRRPLAYVDSSGRRQTKQVYDLGPVDGSP